MESSTFLPRGTISEVLTRLRDIHRPTPQELADAVGMSYTTYLKTERGQREPSFLMILKLCRLYKTDLFDFVSQLSDGELERTELGIEKQRQKIARKKAEALKAKVVDLKTGQAVSPLLYR